MIELAAENMVDEYPEELLEMTDQYMTNLSNSLDEMRPVDRTAAASEQTATELYSRLTDVSPEQSAELALAVSEALPESSNVVAEAYVTNLIEAEQATPGDTTANIETAVNEYVTQIAEIIPEYAVDIASTMVDSVPDIASDMVEILQCSDVFDDSELSVSIKDKPEHDALEEQLQYAVQTQADEMDKN